jgi:hypothetical protein
LVYPSRARWAGPLALVDVRRRGLRVQVVDGSGGSSARKRSARGLCCVFISCTSYQFIPGARCAYGGQQVHLTRGGDSRVRQRTDSGHVSEMFFCVEMKVGGATGMVPVESRGLVFGQDYWRRENQPQQSCGGVFFKHTARFGRFTNSGLTIQVYLPNMARSYEIFSEKGRKSRENP